MFSVGVSLIYYLIKLLSYSTYKVRIWSMKKTICLSSCIKDYGNVISVAEARTRTSPPMRLGWSSCLRQQNPVGWCPHPCGAPTPVVAQLQWQLHLLPARSHRTLARSSRRKVQLRRRVATSLFCLAKCKRPGHNLRSVHSNLNANNVLCEPSNYVYKCSSVLWGYSTKSNLVDPLK